MTSNPLTDNYKNRAEEFSSGDLPTHKKILIRDTYILALKSVMKVVEGMKCEEHISGELAANVHNAALDTLKAELEQAMREIEAKN